MFNLKITKMKKLFFLVSLLVLIGVSGNVMGQDATQYPGETHKFTVTNHPGANYVWKIYTTASLSTEISYTDVATLATAGTNEVSVTWEKNAVGHYFVGVTETIGSCSTKRYSDVLLIAADYDLLVENKDASNTIPLTSCMNGEGRIFSMSAPITALTNDLYFKVTLNNGASAYSNGDWKFDYNITVKDQNSTPADKATALNATVSLVSTGTGMPTINSLSGTDVAVSKQSTFIVKVVINDNPGTAVTDNIDVVFTASNLRVGPGEILETTSTPLDPNTITYTRTTYPNISTITIN